MASDLKSTLTKLKKTYQSTIRDVETSGITERIFLSSPRLNFLFGGGFPVGRIFQFHGPESSGKSTLSTYIAGEIQKQPVRNVVVYVDFERTFDKDFAANLGLDLSKEKFIFLRPENGEEAFTILEELLRTGEIGLVIWDSATTTPTASVIAAEYGKANFGGGAKLFSEALKKFNPLLEKFKTGLIMISQERDNVGSFGPGPDFKVADGRAIKFYATVRNRITKIDTIKEKGEVVGIVVRVRNGKNKAGIPFRDAELNLNFKTGFNVDNEYIDFVTQLGVVTQAGAYFKSEKYGFNLQGREKLEAWFAAHPTEYAEIKLQVNNMLCGVTALDVDGASGYDEEDTIAPPEFVPEEVLADTPDEE